MLIRLQHVVGDIYMAQTVHAGHPDQGLPGGGGYPDQGLPGMPGHPDQGLPSRWPNYPTTGPVFPGKPVDPGYGIPPGHVWWPVDPGYGRPARPPRPDQGLPGQPQIPGVPDNTLPTTPPPQVPAGSTLVMVRTPDGKWHWAVIQPGAPVPTPLPVPPPTAQPKS